MPTSRHRAPIPFLLEPRYWRQRLRDVDLDRCGLLVLPRSDLSTPAVQVDELRVRTHDGIRLWGLRGRSPFHAVAARATIHLVGAFERPEISNEVASDGGVDFVFQVPAGRRLEDRVLDVLRLCQLVAGESDLSLGQIQLVHRSEGHEPDEFMIARRLLEAGLED